MLNDPSGINLSLFSYLLQLHTDKGLWLHSLFLCCVSKSLFAFCEEEEADSCLDSDYDWKLIYEL